MDDVRTALLEGRMDLPRVGEVRAGGRSSLPYLVVDAREAEVEPISKYLRDLALSDASPLTCRSYAHDLLRWWRLLDVLGVGWAQATSAEVTVLVGWLRTARNPQRRRTSKLRPGTVNLRTGKAALPGGYAASTINHTLSVLSGFYAFHAHYGRGPASNPVPDQQGRRALLAHRNPLEPHRLAPRARLRQKVVEQAPRSIPDPLWAELFEAMTCDRDRALLAFYVSGGARASELLELRLDHVDWAGMRIWVTSKGSHVLQEIPASPEAFGYLALYLDEHGLPERDQPVWRALHGTPRPLTYSAMRTPTAVR
ncbi:site-specific integrase [Nonomuraea sp. NPDC049141]|uniref:tyrosine-type recombinase/integrase n=1 Tax=unclassified Nonomuraea TaxID=2593643 RepID=UPI0033D961F5